MIRATPFTVKSVFECAVSLARIWERNGTPVTLCFHINIIFNILMGKCWQYFRFEMRRLCKPVFTEAGGFRQNKSSTAVSAKIKVHRFISCKQGLKLTDANKENIVQAEQAHRLLDENINIAVGVYMNLFLKGTDLREVSMAFFPSYHCSSISATCCQRVKFSLSAAFVLCRF